MPQTLPTIPAGRSRQQWAEIINADWRKSVESIVQTGRDLNAAKEELGHGEFMAMVKRDLLFDIQKAERLMRVARHPSISNSYNFTNLPQTISALIELAPLSEADFNDAQAKGLIEPGLKTNAARAITAAYSRPEGQVVPGGARHTLPSADEARKIALATGRFVAARDGNIYSGATKEEGQAYRDKRNAAFAIIEAIQLLSEAPFAHEWLRNSERHWFVDFRPGSIDDARKWLADLKEAMEIVDA